MRPLLPLLLLLPVIFAAARAQQPASDPEPSALRQTPPGVNNRIDGIGVLSRLGTAPLPLSAWIGSVFDVRAFGAKGDCVTDDAPAIQSAINAAANSPDRGGQVYLPETVGACYLIRSPLALPGSAAGAPGNLHRHIVLRGNGQGATVLRAGATMTAMVQSTGTWNWGNVVTALSLDGNGQAEWNIDHPAGTGFLRIEGIYALNGKAGNLRSGDAVLLTGSLLLNDDKLFTNPASLPRYNLVVTSSDSIFMGNHYVNAGAANVRDTGANNRHVGNHAWGHPAPYMPERSFDIAGSSIWIGNTSDGSRGDGVVIAGSGAQFIGNRVQGAQGRGIRIAANTADIIVTGNHVLGLAPATAIVQEGSPAATAVVRENASATQFGWGPVLNGTGMVLGPNILAAFGSYGHLRGPGAFGVGDGVNDHYRRGGMHMASGATAASGDAQTWHVVHRGAGNNGTVAITALGSGPVTADRIIRLRTDLPAAMQVTVNLQAVCASGDAASWNTRFTVKANRSAASVSFVDGRGANAAPTWTRTAATGGAAEWTPAVVLDTTNGGAYVTGTGRCDGGRTINWTADIATVEAAAAAN